MQWVHVNCAALDKKDQMKFNLKFCIWQVKKEDINYSLEWFISGKAQVRKSTHKDMTCALQEKNSLF